MNPKSNRPKGIKPSLFAVLLLCAAVVETGAQPSAGGIVYGPKGAFNISAPKGWVLDPSAGAEQRLPCVLYPKGASWESADPLMYAKIASTDYEDYEAFAAIAIKEMKKQRGELKVKRVESGKTAGGQRYFINEYPPGKSYGRYERVAYIQLPKAVAYIVYSADDKALFRKHQGALQEALKSLVSMDVDHPDKTSKSPGHETRPE